MKTVRSFSRHSRPTSSCMSARMPGSRAPKGSSSSRIARVHDQGLGQGQALLHAPGQRVRVLVQRLRPRPTASSICLAWSRASRRADAEQPPGQRRGLQLQARASRCPAPSGGGRPNSAGRRCPGPAPAPPAAAAPSSRIWPRVGASSPRSRRRKVVLPQPEAPTMVQNSPAGDLQVDPLQDHLVPVLFPQVADGDARAHGLPSRPWYQGNRSRESCLSPMSVT